MADMLGTKDQDTVSGTMQGDYISTGAGDDQAWGNGGDDRMLGGSGDDQLYGDSAASPEVPLLQIVEDHPVTVTFDYEGAGFKNTFGVYKVDSETGVIKDVSIVWENASLQGSGGDLIGGVSQKAIDVQAGDQLGFFLMANGYNRNDFDGLGEGQFEFRNADGSVATLASDSPSLYHIAADGTTTLMQSNIYHSAGYGENVGLNPDDMLHTVGVGATDDGKVTLGFEDLYNGGDKDFDDAVFTVDIGTANVRALNAHFHTRLQEAAAEARDVLRADGEGAGSDTIMGGKGADYIDGMEGNDLLAGGGVGKEWQKIDGKWVYVGLQANEGHGKGNGNGGPVDNSDDVIIGGEGEDVLIGGGGDDVMDGSTGDDILNGGRGNDAMLGGAGNDTLNGDDGKDEIGGGDGNDVLNGGKDDDQLFGEAGDDILNGGHGKDYLAGGDGADELSGGDGKDELLGEAGNDKLNGGDGDDLLMGGAGDDVLNGNDGHDEMAGGDGDDIMSGDVGHDTMAGEAGNDRLYAGDGNDVVTGGAGDDQIHGDAGNDMLSGDDGDDVIYAGDGNDTVSGGDGNDILYGREGNDAMTGDAGDDKLYAGDGNDAASGGEGNDELQGYDGKDVLSGDAGNDKIVGGADRDVIDGGAGNDHLWGGNWRADQAADVFVFSKGSGTDWIHDFELDHDMIDLKAFESDWESVKNNMNNRYGSLFIDLAAIGGEAGDGLYLKGMDVEKMSEDSFII